ncbi:induced myeloid leukemia cell differentiation protein Mcl-1b [Synchiropus picturatus]
MSLPLLRPNRVGFTSGLVSQLSPQNGAVEETFSSAKPALPGTVAAPRPRTLDVNSNDIASKNIHAEVDDGSLPCTPEILPGLDELACSVADAALEADTRDLIHDSLSQLLSQTETRWSESPALTTMKRVVKGLLEKHKYVYKGIISKFTEDKQAINESVVNVVSKSMFSDGKTNWGRIASLVAFGVTVCQYLKERGQTDCVSLVSKEISSYLLLEQRDWLLQNNSWDGFAEFFRVSDPESSVRNVLMAVLGVAGIGASLAMLLRK